MGRRILLAVTVVLVAVTLGGGLALAQLRRTSTPFPCIDSSREGWLTAVAGGLLLRVEWGAHGQLSITEDRTPVSWRDVGSPTARETAQAVLRPLSGSQTAASPGTVSLYVVCDGVGEYWRGTNAAPESFRQCLRPRPSEGRLDCVRRVFASQRSAEGMAGGILEQVAMVAKANDVPLPASPPAWGAAPPSTWDPREVFRELVDPPPTHPPHGFDPAEDY